MAASHPSPSDYTWDQQASGHTRAGTISLTNASYTVRTWAAFSGGPQLPSERFTHIDSIEGLVTVESQGICSNISSHNI